MAGTSAIEVDGESLRRFGAVLVDRLGPLDGRAVMVVSDRNVAGLYGERICHSLRAVGVDAGEFVIEPGESSKSLASAEAIYRYLADRRLGRDGIIVALGGGVVCDLAGYVAATWMRGVRWVCCPTSLEAMIDAGIGGKTAVNLPGGKNLVGAFHPPELVLIDPTCLSTLPEREFRAALSESVKHALLDGEVSLAWHESNATAILAKEPSVLAKLVERNVRFKSSIVERDPYERTDERATLNLGHTLGHAVEEVSGYELRHGECVSIGLAAACELSARLCSLAPATIVRVRAILERFGLPTRVPADLPAASLQEAIARDKKSREGQVRWVLLEAIGRAIIHKGVDESTSRENAE